MEIGSSSSSSIFCSHLTLQPSIRTCPSFSTCGWRNRRVFVQSFSVSYQKFVNFALEETKRHVHLVPSPLQEKFSSISSGDGKGELRMLSFQADKIRLLRSMSIETDTMQVLDFAVFPKLEYDVPIFCANFFTSARTNIVVLDLNPLHEVINRQDYKEKYFKSLIPLGLKYAELLPWGGKLTSESIKFFSPIVIWTKFPSSPENYDILYSAFQEYYKVWLELISKAVEETDASQIFSNREAQHRYLTWRTEKLELVKEILTQHLHSRCMGTEDPGSGLLKKLIGEALAKDLLRSFLFNGVDELGSKNFLDYFPEYLCGDGAVNKKQSIVGKSFENRPWDTSGEFIGN
ncbi:phytochromobilin:ferredoxin oxidoreductase, chloroplastic isoform X1 [Senna tora]|uniref:Phytochromobilin:ferredoxin oxidoreductase, chloroplastic isoform X1 n=1 Tax=Senna tora TaxID=362788 RepID=A0A834TDJ6_9FABA|nr:phytochromobilin:ferredoxin oxidoreductase, chloroplastic isoform X1 [Senna tora]